jgi:hypothetical protein
VLLIERPLEALYLPQALCRERTDERERRPPFERYGLLHTLAACRAGVATARVQAQPYFIQKMKAARIVVLRDGFDKVLPLGYHAERLTLAGVQAFFSPQVVFIEHLPEAGLPQGPSPGPAKLGSIRPA